MWKRLPLKWKVFSIILIFAGISGVISHYFFPRYLGLVWLFFYIIPSNSFIPFPHEPAILYYGKIYGAWVTTIVATVPTVIACYLDYAVLTPLFDRTRLGNIRQANLYQRTLYYFNKAPFLTNTIAALSPVPFYPVRILSISSGYSAWKYTTAVVLGRIPRYFFLAAMGDLFQVPNWFIGLFFILIGISFLYQRYSLSQSRKPSPVAPQRVTPAAPQEPLYQSSYEYQASTNTEGFK